MFDIEIGLFGDSPTDTNLPAIANPKDDRLLNLSFSGESALDLQPPENLPLENLPLQSQPLENLPQTAPLERSLEIAGNIDPLSGLAIAEPTGLTGAEADILFDPDYYARANPDLREAGLTAPEQLYRHWQQFGLPEGREFSLFVQLDYYGAKNPDLAAAGLNAPQQLYGHLQVFGLLEGREFSPWVDLDYYLDANPDLQLAFGTNTEQAFAHLQAFGFSEGRRFSRKFDLDFYLNNNPDLQAVFGSNRRQAFQHLQGFAIAEGRKMLPLQEPIDQPANQPANQPIDRPIDRPVQEPIEQPSDRPVEEPIEQPVEEPVNQPVQEPVIEPEILADRWEIYIVKSGDTLAAIAESRTGNPQDYQAIVNYPDNDIENPDLIYPGQEIWVPIATGNNGSGTDFNFDRDRVFAVVPPSILPYAEESIPIILSEAESSGVTDAAQLAYILATAEHESLLGRWMEELADGRQYEGRRDLGNTQPGDGPRYKGRGYVQITGRFNYTDWSNRLGIDLVSNPERASEPDIAALVLVRGMRDGTFTGAKLDDYINENQIDFFNARRIVNGLDRAGDIAAIAEYYFQALT